MHASRKAATNPRPCQHPRTSSLRVAVSRSEGGSDRKASSSLRCGNGRSTSVGARASHVSTHCASSRAINQAIRKPSRPYVVYGVVLIAQSKPACPTGRELLQRQPDTAAARHPWLAQGLPFIELDRAASYRFWSIDAMRHRHLLPGDRECLHDEPCARVAGRYGRFFVFPVLACPSSKLRGSSVMGGRDNTVCAPMM